MITGNLPDEVSEASGVAVSRRTPGILWVHNDDEPAVIFAVDSTGTLKGRVRVAGAVNVDWEDIAAGPCGDETCLFVGDIGDNKQNRKRSVIYAFTEPLPSDTETQTVVRYEYRLPDRPQDTEALFVTRDGRMFVITKGRSGPVGVFEFPRPLTTDSVMTLRPVAALTDRLVQLPDMITGAAAAPSRNLIAIRSYSALRIYGLHGDELRSIMKAPASLEPLDEPQGEGVDIRDDGTVFVVSEKGFGNRATIGRLHCAVAD